MYVACQKPSTQADEKDAAPLGDQAQPAHHGQVVAAGEVVVVDDRMCRALFLGVFLLFGDNQASFTLNDVLA